MLVLRMLKFVVHPIAVAIGPSNETLFRSSRDEEKRDH